MRHNLDRKLQNVKLCLSCDENVQADIVNEIREYASDMAFDLMTSNSETGLFSRAMLLKIVSFDVCEDKLDEFSEVLSSWMTEAFMDHGSKTNEMLYLSVANIATGNKYKEFKEIGKGEILMVRSDVEKVMKMIVKEVNPREEWLNEVISEVIEYYDDNGIGYRTDAMVESTDNDWNVSGDEYTIDEILCDYEEMSGTDEDGNELDTL